MTTVEVISPGPLTTIQDLGRPGWAHIGVPRSGAADRVSLRLANALVGNDEGAAALETTLAGPALRFDEAATVALTGAPVSAQLADRPVPMDVAVEIHGGEILRVGNARSGLRTYIAFAGGIDIPLELGSAATDTLTGLGPAALVRGQILRLGRTAGVRGAPTGSAVAGASSPPTVAGASSPPTVASASSRPILPILQVVLGPRQDWFTAAAVTQLIGEPFTVSPASSRVGLRLDGPVLERTRRDELPSEGLVPGAIQVPADGHPILLLTDHPTTGGYPVIAVVIDADLRIAAQLRPGQELRFATVPA
jgi:biotin-dependent carboxylase-like uncharacterized protein